MAFILNPYAYASNFTLMGILSALGHAAHVKLCVDIPDDDSYPGSGQTIFDRSGNSNNFYLGSTSGVDATDPAFFGTPGDLEGATYLQGDGADFCQEASASMSLVSTLAVGAKYSVIILVYPAGLQAGPHGIFGDAYLSMVLNSAEKLEVSCDEVFTVKTSSNAYTVSAVNFMAVSVDEAGGASGSFIQMNGTKTTFNGAITGGPGSFSPTYFLMKVAGVTPMINTMGFIACAMLDTNLSQSQMQAVYDRINANRYALAA